MPSNSIDWEAGEPHGLVDIGSHKLYLHASGPDREAGDPVAVIMPGLGGTPREWAAGQRKISPLIRTYLYDRSGFGNSEASPAKPTSTNIVNELDLLLQRAQIKPPYILVGHSWGGLLSREFLALRPDTVGGLVLVEANQEHTLEILDWQNPILWTVGKSSNDRAVIGLETEHKLTEKEWNAYLAERDTAQYKTQSAAEVAEYRPSFPVLGTKHQLHRAPPLLGDKPVYVIRGSCERDFKRRYEAGVEAGNGTEEERKEYLRILESWPEKDTGLQKEPLTLSSNSHFVHTDQSGHNVHITQPEIIADGVKWILDHRVGNQSRDT